MVRKLVRAAVSTRSLHKALENLDLLPALGNGSLLVQTPGGSEPSPCVSTLYTEDLVSP